MPEARVSRAVVWALVVEGLVAVILASAILDLRMHAAEERTTGVNARGLRGTLRLEKPAGWRRVMVAGGSAAFSSGLPWPTTFPYYLEQTLNQRWREGWGGFYTNVVNVAAAGDGAASYPATLAHYASFAPDLICLYDGYSGTGSPNGVRGGSSVYARTGYVPLLPRLLSKEPAWYASGPARIDPLLDDATAGDPSCGAASASYCGAMLDAVAWARGRGLGVVVASPPFVSRRHAVQQASLAAALAVRFGGDARVRYASLGRAIDLHDPKMSADGVYPTAAGNQTLAESLVDIIFAALRAQQQTEMEREGMSRAGVVHAAARPKPSRSGDVFR